VRVRSERLKPRIPILGNVVSRSMKLKCPSCQTRAISVVDKLVRRRFQCQGCLRWMRVSWLWYASASILGSIAGPFLALAAFGVGWHYGGTALAFGSLAAIIVVYSVLVCLVLPIREVKAVSLKPQNPTGASR
jgi:hypothetical protein